MDNPEGFALERIGDKKSKFIQINALFDVSFDPIKTSNLRNENIHIWMVQAEQQKNIPQRNIQPTPRLSPIRQTFPIQQLVDINSRLGQSLNYRNIEYVM